MGWDLNYLVMTAVVVGITAGFLIAWLVSRYRLDMAKLESERLASDAVKIALLEYKSSQEIKALLDLRFRDGHQAGSSEAINQYKNSEGYDALFQIEHEKGVNAGIEKERERWGLTYTPIIVSDEGYFSHTVEIGYEMQINYNGFPINDPARRITETRKKSKDENIEKLVELANKVAEVAMSIALRNKIPATINAPKTENKVPATKKK